MAEAIVIATIVLAMALTYWRPLRRVRTALGLNHLIATGHVFLLLGLILGPLFGEGPNPFADDLSPIVAFVAGWVGFATGMRFDLRVLRTIPGRAFVVALLPPVAAAAVVGALAAALLLYVETDPTQTWAAALVLAAAAASSGPTLVAMIRARRPGRSLQTRPVLRMLEFAAGVDDIVVAALALLAFAVFRAGPAETVAPIWFITAAIGGGVLLGGVTWLFLGAQALEDEYLLLGLGMLAFIAGFADWLLLSPAAVAAVAAMTLVNLPGDRTTQLLVAVRRVERPAVVIMMVVIGFHISGGLTWVVVPLIVAMTLVRLLCKRWAGNLGPDLTGMRGLSTSRGWGDGLAPQGILGLVVTLSFFQVWGDELARTVLGAVAIASILNEIVATLLLLRLLRVVTGPNNNSADKPSPEGTA